MKVFSAETLLDTSYSEVLSLLESGAVVGFPTDTAYGLGADPFNESAIDRIFDLKGRPEAKPILLVVNALAMAESVALPTPRFAELAAAFWPGPLTLIVHAAAILSDRLTAGTRTIGLRWPDAPIAETLIGRFGKPLTATSANRSGMPAAVTADEVREQLGDKLDCLIDGGRLPSRGGSTILDLTSEPPALVRRGPIAFETLQDILGEKLRRADA